MAIRLWAVRMGFVLRSPTRAARKRWDAAYRKANGRSDLTIRTAVLSLAAAAVIAGSPRSPASAVSTASAVPNDSLRSPVERSAAEWWRHAVIYEIYTRSFQDSNADGVGDLLGVVQRLDYLAGLGVDAIWLTPFFRSPNADFGYDVADYTNVAAEYGTLADWDTLVREAARRGIRILPDLVLNHSSDQHPWFRASRSSRSDPKRDWYVWRDGRAAGVPPTNWLSIFGGSTWTWDPGTSQWYYHVFLPQQPDLNWASEGLRAAMFDVVRFWLNRGAGGFRLDATPYLFEDPAFPDDADPAAGAPVWAKPYNSGRDENHTVLRALRTILNGYPGERVLLGESATSTIDELATVYGRNSDEINLPMDFLFGNLHKLSASDFKRQVDAAELQLHGEPPVLFLSSHDHSRQWSAFGDGVYNDRIAKLTAALTLSPGGAALLYYGEEIGMADMSAQRLQAAPLGVLRPRADERDRSRTPMQWDSGPHGGFTRGMPWIPAAEPSRYNVQSESTDPGSILQWYRRLIRLRRTDAALKSGAYVPLQSGDADIFSFARRTPERSALVLFNMSARHVFYPASRWSAAGLTAPVVLLSNPDITAPSKSGIRLPPYAVVILGADSRRSP